MVVANKVIVNHKKRELKMNKQTKSIFYIGQMVLCLFLFNQSVLQGQDTKKIIKIEASEALQEVAGHLEGLEKHLNISFENSGSIKLGAYIQNLNFEDAYNKHYPHCYGVLVTGLIRGGNAQKAGLIKGDIIMEFDGEKVLFENHLLSLRDSKSINDTVELTLFRNEKILTKILTLNPPQPKMDKDGKVIIKNKKKSVGYGGGGPMAMIIEYDLGINGILEANGFTGLDMPLIIYGGGGSGNIGKGLFIGGMGGGTQLIQQIPFTNSETNEQGYKRYQLDFGFGGVTVIKKLPLFSEKVILDFGILMGGGQTRLTMATTDGNYSWENVIQDMNTNVFQIEKNFMVYRPSAGIMVRVTDWFGITVNAGYLGTFSPNNEWKDTNFDFTVGGNTPNNIGHLSYSIGAWFGH